MCCLAYLVSCGSIAWADESSRRIRAFVSILPQEYFVQRVAGDRVDVEVLVGPGQSPATYEPTPKQIARLSESDVYFRIGVPFENRFIDKIRRAHETLKIVDTREGVALRAMSDPHTHGEEEGGAHDPAERDTGLHEAGLPDPHIWLDPQRVRIQARTIHDALVDMDPAHAEAYGRNLRAFLADLDRVDEEISKALASLRGREFFVFHPSYGYFGEAYGLKQVAVETGGKEPSARQLAALIDRARAEGVRVIFVQPQFSRKTAETLAQSIGGVVVPMDPLARDYLSNLEQMAARLAEALGR